MGVASNTDITQGLPRVQEIFEARNPKGKRSSLRSKGKSPRSKKMLQHVPRKSLFSGATGEGEYVVHLHARMKVEVGDQVLRGDALTEGFYPTKTPPCRS